MLFIPCLNRVSSHLCASTANVAHRVAGLLERRGLLERDAQGSYLALESGDSDLKMQLQGGSITYRIAAGCKQS